MIAPTPIATFEHILSAVEHYRQLQATMRQNVLDQEFRRLPAIAREFRQTVAQVDKLVHDYITSTNADTVHKNEKPMRDGSAIPPP